MPKFVEVLDDEDGYWTYKAGDITVTARKYALGQHRLQIWYETGSIPDVIGPEC